MTLKRKRDGTYEARYYKNGTKSSPYLRENFGKVSPQKAKELYRKKLAEAAARRERGTHSTTFEALALRYLEVRGPKMSERSKVRAEGIIRNHLVPKFGTRRVDSIGSEDVESFLNERVKEGAAKSTANREWNTMRAILRWGKAKRNVEAPALAGVDVFRLEHRGAKIVFLEPDEWRRLRAAFENAEAWKVFVMDRRRIGGLLPESDAGKEYLERLREVVPVFDALLYTGGRIGDVLSLRWQDVDLKAKRITLRPEKTKGKPVVVPIAAPLLVHLKEKSEPDELVFPFDQMRVQRAFNVARELAGLPKRITPHALRHTLGAWLARSGESLRKIQEILGHADPAITARHYAHLLPGDLESAIEKVEELATA